MTPAERTRRLKSLAGYVGATTRTLDPSYDGRSATQKARDSQKASFLAEHDPNGKWSAEQAERKYRAYKSVQLARGRLAKLKKETAHD